MRLLLVSSFVIVFYTLDFRNLFSNASPAASPPLTEEDKDTIGILKLWGTANSYGFFQEKNVTLYKMAKSIVDHKIADNKTLAWATAITDDWDPDLKQISENTLSNLNENPANLLKHFYNVYMSENKSRKRTMFNTWTNGEFEIIFKALNNKVKTLKKEFEDMMDKSIEKLSDNTKVFYRSSIEEANNPDKNQAFKAKDRFYVILVKNRYF
ncbi:hypothetical protein KR215_005584 [Drosophila sulfurigaster]|nr:hypothetical protein KR215_005584 [Drosophila sulfurigaster]